MDWLLYRVFNNFTDFREYKKQELMFLNSNHQPPPYVFKYQPTTLYYKSRCKVACNLRSIFPKYALPKIQKCDVQAMEYLYISRYLFDIPSMGYSYEDLQKGNDLWSIIKCQGNCRRCEVQGERCMTLFE